MFWFQDGNVKRRDILLHVQVCEEEKIEGKIESEWIALESSLTCTSLEAPRQPRLFCKDMQRTTVGVSSAADSSLKQGGITKSLSV